MRTRALKPIQTTKNVENILSCTEEGQPLSPIARMFHELESDVYAVTAIGFQTQINPEVADEKYGGQLKWVRTEVDLDNHVKVPSPDLNQVES
ncbi:hypothetical protein DKX38_029515 [Salix brachista]|uniref:Uncharacterized protein n=1 Tax=Salix brachista TaxID=2182728 RepID=A0A5N5JBM9_9ROSI|nr:hypothetical protein DKX38_029515 [Salix brachista]